MTELTVIMYTIALVYILWRAGAAVKRAIDVATEAIGNGHSILWPLAPLADGLFWSRVLQFAMDIIMSSLGMMFTRIAIAGTASAPIGALLGLACSFGITGAGAYARAKQPAGHN